MENPYLPEEYKRRMEREFPLPTPDEAMEMAQQIIDQMPESDEKIAAQMMHDELVSRRERTKNG